MPGVTQTNGRGRFELPVLGPLDSLTAGTNIPPPPDSPIEEKPAIVFPAVVEPSEVSAVAEGAPVNGHIEGRGRTNGHNGPLSPTSPMRAGSIRRFLSRKSLNSNYKNGTNTNDSQEDLNGYMGFRPESSLSTASGPMKSKKRSSSWFRRLMDGDSRDSRSKRTSIVYEEKQSLPKGPPPPTLPELSQLKAKVFDDEGSLGSDMFKNIK